MWDKIMLRKRYIIKCINELLKNKANLVHSQHRSIHNFIMNLCSALTAYCFFDNKPEALPVYVEKSRQLELFAYWSYPELAYTHKTLRSAFLSLKRNMPWLWTYYDYPELEIPNTNNGIESLNADLKTKLNLHKGISTERRKVFIQDFIMFHSPNR